MQNHFLQHLVVLRPWSAPDELIPMYLHAGSAYSLHQIPSARSLKNPDEFRDPGHQEIVLVDVLPTLHLFFRTPALK